MKRTVTLASIVALIVIALPAAAYAGSCSGCNYDSKAKVAKTQADIVDTAVKAGQFNTLVAAVKAAGLVDTLKSDGPFTVFAPTDAAFAKLPHGTLEMLLKPENKGLLTAILTYHVVPGNVPAAKAVKLSNAVTANGQQIDLKYHKGSQCGSGTLTIDGARVVKADIHTSNGVIHVIDSVIMPSTSDIVATAVEAGSFKTLAAALNAAGLVEALQGHGPFTVFAPSDDAFAKLPEGTVDSLLKPENRGQLTAILKHHVVSGRIFASHVTDGATVETLNGTTLTADVGHHGVKIGNAKVVSTDIDASNGVIHVIDSVLLPPSSASASAGQ